jgi:hypothetical protein
MGCRDGWFAAAVPKKPVDWVDRAMVRRRSAGKLLGMPWRAWRPRCCANGCAEFWLGTFGGRGVVVRFNHRIARGVDSREQFDPAFCRLQQAEALPQQADPLFVASQRLGQSNPAFFEFVHDRLHPSQRGLEVGRSD